MDLLPIGVLKVPDFSLKPVHGYQHEDIWPRDYLISPAACLESWIELSRAFPITSFL